MQKESYQQKPELNYQTTGQCCELEEDREESKMYKTIIITITTTTIMIMTEIIITMTGMIIMTITIITEIIMIILEIGMVIIMKKIRIMNKIKATSRKEEKIQDIMDSK